MARGYLVETDRDSGRVVRESDTATCGHCGLPMQLPPPKNGQIVARISPPCMSCMKYICNVCVQTPGCDPWEKQMERMEAAEKKVILVGR